MPRLAGIVAIEMQALPGFQTIPLGSRLRTGPWDFRSRARMVCGIGLVLVGMALTSGCLFQKKKPGAFVPPPPRPVAKIPAAPSLPDAGPDVEVSNGSAQVAVGEIPLFPNIPEPPKPAKPRPPIIAGPKTPTTPLPDQPAPPKLGQIFTAEQVREYNRDLDDSLERVRRALSSITRRRLSSEDGVTLERIRTFQKPFQHSGIRSLEFT